LAIALAGGCNHSEPFQPGDLGPTTPRDGSLPYQMTLSVWPDLSPARAADGNWLYAYTENTAATINRCLAELPLDGGSRSRTKCDVSLGIPGTNSSLTWPAESPDGKLAYMRGTSQTTVPGPNGLPMTLQGRGVTVWRFEPDGQWRCVVDIWNDPPPAAPAAK